jgi:hypothetical protein
MTRMKVTGRELSVGVIVLAFIGGAYVLSQYTGERGRMIRIGYAFFAEKGRRVGRVLCARAYPRPAAALLYHISLWNDSRYC